MFGGGFWYNWFVALGFVVALAGCSSVSSGEAPAEVKTVVVQYKGNPLTCVESMSSHAFEILDCDYVEYHEKFGFPE